MPRHRAAIYRLSSVLALSALAAGCASAPPAHYYTLAALAPPAASRPAPTALAIAVGPLTLPAIVDRPQIVVRSGANAVYLDELNRWASPLQDNMARVIADNLAAQLASPRVHLYTQNSSGEAQYRVSIDVQEFTSAPGQSAQIDALWSVRRTRDGKTQSGRSTSSEAPSGPGYEALAAAHSRALARLAADLGAAIDGLERAVP
jgi:uncharacterized lipoprotein YmbA